MTVKLLEFAKMPGFMDAEHRIRLTGVPIVGNGGRIILIDDMYLILKDILKDNFLLKIKLKCFPKSIIKSLNILLLNMKDYDAGEQEIEPVYIFRKEDDKFCLPSKLKEAFSNNLLRKSIR